MSLQNPLPEPADYSVSRIIVVAFAVVLISIPVATKAQQTALRVLASNGVKAALEELEATSERQAGRSIEMTFGTSASTKQRIEAGEAFDVAVLTSEVMDELAKAGKIVAASRKPLGRSGIGIGARAGATKVDIRSAETLKRTLVNARALTWASDGASRPHIARMLERLGIAEAVHSKTILEQGSVRAAARVASGDAEFIITLISEIMPVPGLELVGPLPKEFQNYVSFAAAIGSSTANVEAARALTVFLSSPAASPAFTTRGIER
jgi:molybdate transport system substrate-binding protein